MTTCPLTGRFGIRRPATMRPVARPVALARPEASVWVPRQATLPGTPGANTTARTGWALVAILAMPSPLLPTARPVSHLRADTESQVPAVLTPTAGPVPACGVAGQHP